jgi:UDP-3-O-[3-hydroxymyristoyl] glucosamine N-acyltransferase
MAIEYRICHDNGKPLCFVGRTFHNSTLHRYFGAHRYCHAITVEELERQDTAWAQKYQFFCGVSNISFKMRVKQAVDRVQGHCFSVIGDTNAMGQNVQIGKGTLILNFNSIYDNTVIGDFCTITNFISISHDVTINNFCHIAHYSYFSFSEIGQGCYTGLRTSVFGYPETPIKVSAYTNLLADSRVTASIDQPGTYYGRRMSDSKTSLELAL